MPLPDICSICYDEFNDPISLPCNHTYCRKCIVQALEEKQSCPICRRLCCNYLNQPFKSENLLNQQYYCQNWNPCFAYRIFIPHDGFTQFNFFEERYVTMITEVLQNNLTFIIDPQYNDCCIRVKLTECIPVHQHSVYVCKVQNIERLKIVESTFRDLENSDTLKYVTTKSLIDIVTEECLNLYLRLYEYIDELVNIIQLCENEKAQLYKIIGNRNEITQESISGRSLKLLSTIKICENGLLKYYFSTDLKERLEVIIKHYESYLNYYKNQ